VLLESPEFGVGDTNAYCRPDFVMFQTYQIDCFTMQQKADQPHNSDSVVKSTSSTSTKPLQVENSTFFGKDAGKNTAQNSSKRQFKRKKSIFPEFSETRPAGRGTLPTSHPCPLSKQTLWIGLCIPQNSSQIYTTGFKTCCCRRTVNCEFPFYLFYTCCNVTGALWCNKTC